MRTKKIIWLVFALACILIGLYPTLYFVLDRKFALLKSKDAELLSNVFWNIAFYIHIVAGGIALLIGWTQFSRNLREKNIKLHRQTGKIYVIASLLSAVASLKIAYHATGGLITSIGFTCLGIIWLGTTWLAYSYIIRKQVLLHQQMMLYSYAACFAAVTLRIWLPLLVFLMHDFTPAYRTVSWLCWIPNLLIAYWMGKRLENSPAK
ncbi:DUF2306 domain-containing protein [Pedobacter cryoconitis]|uniref:Putative membrane protein n=1 Tax=Pedobacter cryoconitis TaxID=188932 RepID=A0A7X0MK34_9SPHI|nr:DUF2306 domain-containing protein [Pedobacter cryoconitis]MBB6502142.1 putative membrane protein [Pedobacter cryoconitis]